MEYNGKLYGKIDDKYFDTGRTTSEFDHMQKKLVEIQTRIDSDENDDKLVCMPITDINEGYDRHKYIIGYDPF